MTPLKFFLKVVGQFYKKNKSLTILSFVLACIVPSINVVVSKAFTQLIECMLKKGDVSKYMTYFIASFVLHRIGYIIMESVHMKLLPLFQVFVRSDVIGSVFSRLHDINDHADIGDILSKLSKLPWAIELYFNAFKDHFIPLTAIMVIVGIIAASYDLFIGVGCILMAAIYVFGVIVRGPETCSDISVKRDNEYDRVYSNLEDILRNLSAVYVENKSKHELENLNAIQMQYINKYKSTYDCYSQIHVWITGVAAGTFFLIVGGSYYQVQKGTIDGTTFAFFSILALNILYYLFDTSEHVRELTFQNGIINSILRFMGNIDRNDFQTTVPSLQSHTFAFKLTNVSYAINQKQILRPQTVSIPKHTITLIDGCNGTGKTTLLKVLAGLYTGYGGTLQRSSTEIAYMPQNPTLFSRTLYENLTYGHKNPLSRQQIIEFVKRHNLQSVVPTTRLDQNVGRLGANMSGGQRAWTYFLRLYLNPDKQVFLLDEPTSWIDKRTRPIFIKLLQQLSQHKTIVMVTHDDKLKGLASAIVSL